MNATTKINTAIIDDNEEYLFSLKEHLSFFPEIELIGCATKCKQARNLLLNDQLDLVFLDIELPGKSGFELLNEARNQGNKNFNVIFYTAFDQYVIDALRESAFDYILKPIKPEELKNSIERLKHQRTISTKPLEPIEKRKIIDMITLPTATGIRFIEKDEILMFQCNGINLFDKKCWTAILTDHSEVRLRTGTSAKEIIEYADPKRFILINQSCIINFSYLATIEFKTRECHLIPPFNNIPLVASRSHMTELREKFDLL